MKKIVALLFALLLGGAQSAMADTPVTTASGTLGALNDTLSVPVSSPAASQQYCNVTAPSGLVGTLGFTVIDGGHFVSPNPTSSSLVVSGPVNYLVAIPAVTTQFIVTVTAYTSGSATYTISCGPQPGIGGGLGTVTSVGITVPAFLSVSGSPVVSAGTLALSLVNQAANRVFAGPASGGSAAPGFRTLVLADLPSIAFSVLTGNATAAQGGTGITSYTVGDILYASGSAALSKLGIGSSGQVLTVVGGVPAWQTPASGGVTSVGLSLPAIFNVSGSPVTTSGTLTAALASQSQNLVLASPNGSSGAPAFRALVAADIPSGLPYASTSGTNVFTGVNSFTNAGGVQFGPTSSVDTAALVKFNSANAGAVTIGSNTSATCGGVAGFAVAIADAGGAALTTSDGGTGICSNLSVAGVLSVGGTNINFGGNSAADGSYTTHQTGAPTGACTNSSVYIRADGGAGTTLYVCYGTAWHADSGV